MFSLQPEGPLICYLCNYSIMSSQHCESCDTVTMCQFKTSNYLLEDFKPLMTYGLNGCTALIAINKSSGDIIFCHHPILSQVFDWFDIHYKEKSNYIIIIKSPGDWIKINDKWILVSTNKQELETKFNGSLLILEPYSLNIDITNNFQSTLYLFKKNDSLLYNSNGIDKLIF